MKQNIRQNIDRDIIESLPYALIAVNGSGTISSFNSGAENLTEVSRTAAIGAALSGVFPKDPWIDELFTSTLKHGKSVTSLKTALKRRLSAPLQVSVSTCALIGEDGGASGVIFMIKDVSSLKPLENEERVDESIARVSAFAATLAHEIRNPLGGIRGTAELLRKKLPDDKLKQYASVIIEASDKLNAVVSRMLISDEMTARKKNLNIHKALDSSIGLFEPECAKIEFLRLYDPSLPPVIGDETSLSQVFTNLLKNAVEALNNVKEARITVSTRMVTEFHLVHSGSKEKKFVEIEIRDNGHGISQEVMASVFTPFFTTKRGGSGLGLGISYKIIKEHGGFLRIESMPKTGTQLRVYLPARIK